LDNDFKKAFTHTLNELGIDNITLSLSKGDFQKIRKAHDGIHEFIYLAPLCLPSQRVDGGNINFWHQKSAFLTYQFQVFEQAHRSLESLSGHYNSGYILLRSTLELLLKGTLWECLAHRRFRDDAAIIKEHGKVKIGERKITILDWLSEVFKLDPSIEHDFEETSGAIFDKISPILDDKELRKLIPKLNVIIKQLSYWGVFYPMEYPVDKIHGIYDKLSADVHVIPDKTDIGRRLLYGENLFETEIIIKELQKYIETLYELIDICMVVELNVLENYITQSSEARVRLKDWRL
jgi:hypothetical protein